MLCEKVNRFKVKHKIYSNPEVILRDFFFDIWRAK